MYYDGVMPRDVEKQFSEHLPACKDCMESLLNLHNDLFSMHVTNYKQLPDRLRMKYMALMGKGQKEVSHRITGKIAIFKLLGGKMELKQNLLSPWSFKLLQLSQARGEKASIYHLQKGKVTVELSAEGEDTFKIALAGIQKSDLILKRNNRIIETHSAIESEEISICNLEKGSFLLRINSEDVIQFIVN
jgi:hypothetical protein